MSLPVSTRTIVRDAIAALFQSRKDAGAVRVKQYGISLKYLNPQETKQGNTYCIVLSDEQAGQGTQTQRDWDLELKIVCYASDPKDPHAIVDAMIEDAQDTISLVLAQTDLKDVVWNIRPVSIIADERTTEAEPWGQAVYTWTMEHRRH